MGLSASQGRLLSLTSRLSDLEYRSQSIANSKMRLADKSQEISSNYLDSLSKKKLTVYNPDTGKHIDGTLNSLYSMNGCSTNGKKRVVVDGQGKIVCPAGSEKYIPEDFLQSNPMAAQNPVTSTDLAKARSSANAQKEVNKDLYGSVDVLAASLLNDIPETDPKYQKILAYAQNVFNGTEAFAQALGYTTADPSIMTVEDKPPFDYSNGKNNLFSYDPNLIDKFKTAAAGGDINLADFNKSSLSSISSVSTKNASNTEWLYKQLSMGNLFIVEYNEEGGIDHSGAWETISWETGDSHLVTEADELGLAQAEAEYEKAMADISSKDKKFDLELKSIDSEHNAVQTEVDSVKKVMDKNIESTFKLFS